MSTRADRLYSELEQLKSIAKSSQTYLSSYFAELKISAQNNADLVERITFYENECANNELSNEFKSNLFKKIQSIELKLNELKQFIDTNYPHLNSLKNYLNQFNFVKLGLKLTLKHVGNV